MSEHSNNFDRRSVVSRPSAAPSLEPEADRRDLVIVGNGMAASRLLDDLIQRGATARYRIKVFGEESGGSYNRVQLSKVLGGAESHLIMMKPTAWYLDQGVEFVAGATVTHLDTAAHRVHSSDGQSHPYDLAVLATGSAPFVPPIEGIEQAEGRWKRGVFVYRTLEDCLKIRSFAKSGDNAMVLGGGLLGLEAAKALSDQGLHVTVIHLSPHLMNVQLDKLGAEMLREQIERCGIFVRTGRSIQAIRGTERVEAVVLDDGTFLSARMVVLACGINPRVDVARASGIPVNKGILVNDTLATQVPGVYALGECAEHAGKVYGIVTPIFEQATVLADVLTGHRPRARYRGSKLYARLKVAGIEVASMGLTEPALETDEVIQVIEERKSSYRKLIVRDGRLIGAMLVGDVEASANLVQLFDRGDPLPDNRLDILCSPEATAESSSSDRTICNCNKVSESTLVESIQGGCRSIQGLADQTRAGTGCGSCKGLLAQLLDRHAKPAFRVPANQRHPDEGRSFRQRDMTLDAASRRTMNSYSPIVRGSLMPPDEGLTAEQKNFLQGFAMGADVARAVRSLPIIAGSAGSTGTTISVGGGAAVGAPVSPSSPFPLQIEAQDRFLAQGKTLCNEEKAKRDKDPFSMWDEMGKNAEAGVYPKGTDVFLYKFSGLFQVAPAQDSFMSRLRIPGGVMPTWQFRGVADLARRFAAGHVDCTTRANLQIREIQARDARDYLVGLADYGIVSRGSGADNIRNCTSTPTSGIDPDELIETLPLARAMHHYILNHREMYGLPRKFNIAFEGGGRIASLEDTNDIGFKAVKISEASADADLPAGVYFRLTLGGITGHKDFARDTGVLLKPEECVEVAAAIVRVYLKNGDRTDRKKARLKYVLDAWGFPKFLEEVEQELRRPLRRVDLALCEPSKAEDRWAHVGFHPQKQAGKVYVGVVLPVGRMTSEQVEGLADIADRYGSRTIRLTVWQNLLISDIAEEDIDAVKEAIESIGLHWDASSVRSGLIACTGNAGCKFAGADTKRNAMELAAYLDGRVTLDRPINIHVTGCPNSCAQHYIGDIGLQGTQVEVEEELVEGYHLVIGGGWGAEQGVGRPFLDALPFEKIPPIIERLISHYLANRTGSDESFAAFARRHDTEALRAVALEDLVIA